MTDDNVFKGDKPEWSDNTQKLNLKFFRVRLMSGFVFFITDCFIKG